ncbi:unnamed protein product [Choristocarpus tenellus]
MTSHERRLDMKRAMGAACLAGSALVTAFHSPVGGLQSLQTSLAARVLSGRSTSMQLLPQSSYRQRLRCGPGRRGIALMVSAVKSSWTSKPRMNEKVSSVDLMSGGRKRSFTSGGEQKIVDAVPSGGRLKIISKEEERELIFKIKRASKLMKVRDKVASQCKVQLSECLQEVGITESDMRRTLEEGALAKKALMERNMPFVYKMIKDRFSWRLTGGGSLTVKDLVQEGVYALSVAADRFDPSMNNRFITYAMWVVRHTLDSAVAGGSLCLRIPESAMKEVYAAKRELNEDLGRTPTQEELVEYFSEAHELGDDPSSEKVRERRRLAVLAMQQAFSLESSLPDGQSYSDTIPSGEMFDNEVFPATVDMDLTKMIRKVLTAREATLVRMVFGLDGAPVYTIAQCASILCLSTRKTNTLFQSSLSKLRECAELDRIRPGEELEELQDFTSFG